MKEMKNKEIKINIYILIFCSCIMFIYLFLGIVEMKLNGNPNFIWVMGLTTGLLILPFTGICLEYFTKK